MSFTSGPWIAIAPDVDSPHKAVVARDNRFHDGSKVVCVVTAQNPYPGDPDEPEVDSANTHLLAASREMYDVLEKLQYIRRDGYAYDECPACGASIEAGHSSDCDLYAALAKARGEK